MSGFMGITEKDMLDKRKIKVIDGIAGSGKSSGLHRWLTDRGIDYLRCTSSRLLARDASDRYQMPVNTIASGLFKKQPNSWFFYENPIDPELKTVVIDEVLQTDPAVFEWARSHRCTYNIFMTCDSEQCLSPKNETQMKEAFYAFIKGSKVVYVSEENTKRAADDLTSKWYQAAYIAAKKEDASAFKRSERQLPHLAYDELTYSDHDVYIPYTTELERDLFQMFDLYHHYGGLLVPKGQLQGTARQHENPYNYSILPQIDAEEGVASYWQLRNVATVQRLQGTEVEPDQKCFFIMDRGSFINQRTWYTVITRCKDIRSLVICVRDKDELPVALEKYNDAPVKQIRWYIADGFVDSDGRTMEEMIDGDGFVADSEFWDQLIQKIQENKEAAYRTSAVIVGDRVVRLKGKDDELPRLNIIKELKKAGVFNFSYNDRLYKLYEAAQHDYGTRVAAAPFISPTLVRLDRRKLTVFDGREYWEYNDYKGYEYMIDLKAAYPTILSERPIPVDGQIRVDPEAYGLRLYVGYCDYLPDGCILTEPLKDFVDRGNRHMSVEWAYLCTVPFSNGCQLGGKILKYYKGTLRQYHLAHNIYWGVLEKAYIRPWAWDHDKPTLYMKEPDAIYAPIMIAIRSELALKLLQLKDLLLNDLTAGATNADQLYFDSKLSPEQMVQMINQIYPTLQYRLYRQSQYGEWDLLLYETDD